MDRVKQITNRKLAYAAVDPIGGEFTKDVAAAVRRGGTVYVSACPQAPLYLTPEVHNVDFAASCIPFVAHSALLQQCGRSSSIAVVHMPDTFMSAGSRMNVLFTRTGIWRSWGHDSHCGLRRPAVPWRACHWLLVSPLPHPLLGWLLPMQYNCKQLCSTSGERCEVLKLSIRTSCRCALIWLRTCYG